MNLHHHQTLNYTNVNIGVDTVLLQETAEVLHRLRMEEAESRAFTRHEEIIGGMAETYQKSLVHMESRVKLFESACEERVRSAAAQERDNNEQARKQLIVECEKKAHSVIDGVIADARAAYAQGEREVQRLRAELSEANQRMTTKNQEHLRSVEQLNMKIMLLENRQGSSSPGGGAQVFDMARDDKPEDKESNFDKMEREAKAKLGELRTGFATPIKTPQLYSEPRGSTGRGADPQSPPPQAPMSSGDQLIEALRKVLSSPKSFEELIKVRDAIVAASTNPDAAFAWVSEILAEGRTCEELKSPGNFGTLDAKLMSSLTTILVGDFARRINTLKETEAAKGHQVRGRQVLFLLNEYFSTNAKHGSTYSIQDLFSVKL